MSYPFYHGAGNSAASRYRVDLTPLLCSMTDVDGFMRCPASQQDLNSGISRHYKISGALFQGTGIIFNVNIKDVNQRGINPF